MKTIEIYKLSRVVYKEIAMEAQLTSVGANQARYIDRLSKKKNQNVSTPAIVPKCMTAIFIGFLTFLPIFVIYSLIPLFSVSSPSVVIATVVVIFAIYFALQLMYSLMFGLMTASALFSGAAFPLIGTLPVEKRDITRLGAFSFFHQINIPFIASVLVLPIVWVVVRIWVSYPNVSFDVSDALFIVASIPIGFVIALINESIIVSLAKKFHDIITRNAANTGKATATRMFTLIISNLSGVLVTIIVFLALEWTLDIYVFFTENPSILEWILPILSIVPFILAPAFAITYVVPGMPTPPSTLAYATIIGLVLCCFLARYVFLKAGRSLAQASLTEVRSGMAESQEQEPLPEIKVRTPVRAFIHKDLQTASQDYAILAPLIVIIVMPIIGSFTSDLSFRGDLANTLDFVYVMTNMYGLIGVIFLTYGLLSIENSGASTLASLPVNLRSQAKAKVVIFAIFLPLSAILPLCFHIGASTFIPMLIVRGSFALQVFVVGLITILLKVRLFGKMKRKYVLEDFNDENTIIKWVEIGVVVAGIGIGFGYLDANLIQIWEYIPVTLLNLAIIIPLLIIGIYWFNRLFPKQSKH